MCIIEKILKLYFLSMFLLISTASSESNLDSDINQDDIQDVKNDMSDLKSKYVNTTNQVTYEFNNHIDLTQTTDPTKETAQEINVSTINNSHLKPNVINQPTNGSITG